MYITYITFEIIAILQLPQINIFVEFSLFGLSKRDFPKFNVYLCGIYFHYVRFYDILSRLIKFKHFSINYKILIILFLDISLKL